jgi:CRISPR system Cascade subunit CasB
MTPEPSAQPHETASEWKKRRSWIGKIANQMEPSGTEQYRPDELSAGDLAELRRIRPTEPYTPTLWRVLMNHGIDSNWGEGEWREQREKRWATILMGMAHTIGQHSGSTSLGTALAESGWSEVRFARLMEQRGTELAHEIRRLAKYLSSKSQDVNWADLADLILDQDAEWAESQRRNIARDYYRTLNRIESQSK